MAYNPGMIDIHAGDTVSCARNTQDIRKSFGHASGLTQMPNLIEMQKESYEKFLQLVEPEGGRLDVGLQVIFKSVFPIHDFTGDTVLEFVRYDFGAPKYELDECQRRGMTFAAPLRVTLRLITFETDEDTGSRSVIDIKEQEVYMGDMPIMTQGGTFIINGTERVIVSQMHRSPGVFFEHDGGKTHASGKILFAGRVIPYHGSWLDFEFDVRDIIHVRIDRRRKFPVTTFLYALGFTAEGILNTFYDRVVFEKQKDGWRVPYDPIRYRGINLTADLINAETGTVVLEKNKKITPRIARKLMKDGLKSVIEPLDAIIGRYLADDVVNPETGEIYAEASQEIDKKLLDDLLKKGFKNIAVLDIDQINVGGYIRNTLLADKTTTREQALLDIYRVMRPGEPPTLEVAESLFNGLFFDPERYDLSVVGRAKINMRLDLDCPDDVRVLRQEDIVAAIKTLVSLRDGHGDVDDIDNLGNRRVRSVGELMENQYRIGLIRMERMVRERMSSVDMSTTMPQDLINVKPVVAVIREFFGLSQLSQFMDQTNPLAEVTHKRRISALGPGGLTRDRAGFEVRDVHPTHYGRICPIETPEGQNIGLINSLATYARVNKYGFIESPYRRVVDGKVTDDIVYLSAIEESRYRIAQAHTRVDEDGTITEPTIYCRHGGDFDLVHPEQVDFLDVSPQQIVSVAAALIPFLENNDANRALMGSNMQRQAVPLLRTQAPLVGTNMESIVARDSRAATLARRDGVVEYVDASTIVVRATKKDSTTLDFKESKEDFESKTSDIDIYTLRKFQRSNQSTCINQHPLIKPGDVVCAGQFIADGPSIDRGELALGYNMLVGFMPWNGYNFEDSMLISERIVREDIFTSIHIEEFEVMARDTKLGPEEITRDIPNLGEEALSNLDEVGIVHIGAQVSPGDILVGKVTPKGETQMMPEEKLLRAIFGEKASDVRDTSLRLPPGASGIVVDVRIFNRQGIEKDERALINDREEIQKLDATRVNELKILESFASKCLRETLLNKELAIITDDLPKGTRVLTEEVLVAASRADLWNYVPKDKDIQKMVEAVKNRYSVEKARLQARFEDRVAKIQRGDELPQGVMKMVKVFVAVKRKLQPGDKMAGRHGNKGVISKIVPIEDMPYTEDGTPLDIVLNPLGVPSRMNVGQILETHLGLACVHLGKKINKLLEAYEEEKVVEPLRAFFKEIYNKKADCVQVDTLRDTDIVALAKRASNGVPIATPVFDGAKEQNINRLLELAEVDTTGQVTLFDGRTGEPFDRKVTVGYIYMLKLHHLVDEKIHARSVGPYALVSQQPLGGKAQFGGQRVGEMEVWALQGYGAAYTLKEMLTVKSDDIAGRAKVYSALVRGDNSAEMATSTPESFNVLVKEMQALLLCVETLSQTQKVAAMSKQPQDAKDALLGSLFPSANANAQAQSFDRIRISIASPEQVIAWSYGEVKKPETINYRTFKPERDGLFCARIFGPIKNYECLCGKYKRMKYKGIVCEKCGVEVTMAKVRRERMGHIVLATPVAHIWFLKSLPSRIGLLLSMTLKNLERVLYFEDHVVLEPGLTDLKYGQLLSEREYVEAQRTFGKGAFTAGIGAEAIRVLLANLDLPAEAQRLRAEVKQLSGDKAKKAMKRLKLIESFIQSGNRPEWMVMTVLPVIPPELRPLVPLDGGRFAASDLNDLYRRVINRNNRLRRLLELRAPDIIVRNEKRMLQEAVDALLDNGRRGRVINGTNKRPLRSLTDMLKGKQGRFRQNLLGKRVDYSGRSVIVVGPELRLNQCGLPKKMALELFKPFVFSRLEALGYASTIKQAKKLVEREIPEVWDILDQVIREHPVLLNRAPTLHRLGIQAFEPLLIEGKAIQLHPLVCAAFNADFDGDQMAVHIPLSLEAQLEARVLMMSTNNILHPANGTPIIVPSKDIVLGLYYITMAQDKEPGEGTVFAAPYEVQYALAKKLVTLHTRIKLRIQERDEHGEWAYKIMQTTPGRMLVANCLPKNGRVPFDAVNKLLTNKEISRLVDTVYSLCGQQETVNFCDRIMSLGFQEACRSGLSFGKDDMVVPAEKAHLIQETQDLVAEYEQQYSDGLITQGEKYNKVIDAWSKCTDSVAEMMMKSISAREKDAKTGRIKPINSIYAMAHSGARGSPAQMKQLTGMRGLMAKPNGEIIETPIIANLKEGLSVIEYFNSTHGARKGLADTALKTANSGYLTRRLVDVAQDCIVLNHDCHTEEGIQVEAVIRSGDVIVSLAQRILGRVTAEDVLDPHSGEVILGRNQLIDARMADSIEEAGVRRVRVRSVLTCASKVGVCVMCYGRDLVRGKLVNLGEAVGVIAAQSIGEPGTQLTMRTFHVGGAAQIVDQSFIESNYSGTLYLKNAGVVNDSEGRSIVIGRNVHAYIVDEHGRELSSHKLSYGVRLLVKDGDHVERGQRIAEWDPHTIPILAEVSGCVGFEDLVENVSIRDVSDETTGIPHRTVMDWNTGARATSLHPSIVVKDESGHVMKLSNGSEARSMLQPGAILSVEAGVQIHAGDVLARIPTEGTRTRDITGGLPRVAELFEARRPKDHAVIAEMDGRIEFSGVYKTKRRVLLHPFEDAANGNSGPIEYFFPNSKHLSVQDGDIVQKGDFLFEAHPAPHDFLEIFGVEKLANYIINEVQEIYRLQGVNINDKHIEVIVRQMLQKVQIVDEGDSSYLMGEQVDRLEFDETNAQLKEKGLREAVARPTLSGITKAALHTPSFISAASFQETPRVLTEAATKGSVDYLRGLKENVIVGCIMPAGTGAVWHEKNREAQRLAQDRASPPHELGDKPALLATDGVLPEISENTASIH